MGDTRERIVAAARAILMEDSGAKPSVRAVAAHAGIGASTLRHYFPTQRDLLDAVLESIAATTLPDDRIHDASVPARERLVACMRDLLTPFGTAEQAREVWRQFFRVLVDSDASEKSQSAYTSLTQKARERVGAWLAALQTEGAMPEGDYSHQVIFLLTVIDGLAIGRASPTASLSPDQESALLYATADAVLDHPWPPNHPESSQA